MNIRALVGSGDRIMGLTLPFAAAGIAANVVWPSVFALEAGTAGLVAGAALLVLGVPLWFLSVALVARNVPRGRLVTTGPFALVLHPLYTSVALLVLPGLGLLLDTWSGAAIGAVLYVATRLFARAEERALAERFPAEYPVYRARVRIPWL